MKLAVKLAVRLAVKLPLGLAVRRAVGLAMGFALDMLTHTTISFYTFINSSKKNLTRKGGMGKVLSM